MTDFTRWRVLDHKNRDDAPRDGTTVELGYSAGYSPWPRRLGLGLWSLGRWHWAEEPKGVQPNLWRPAAAPASMASGPHNPQENNQ